MTSLRKRKSVLAQAISARNRLSKLNGLAWNHMHAVGREIGSPDFDLLMDERSRNQAGVFDWALKEHFAEIDAVEKLPVQRRMKI